MTRAGISLASVSFCLGDKKCKQGYMESLQPAKEADTIWHVKSLPGFSRRSLATIFLFVKRNPHSKIT